MFSFAIFFSVNKSYRCRCLSDISVVLLRWWWLCFELQRFFVLPEKQLHLDVFEITLENVFIYTCDQDKAKLRSELWSSVNEGRDLQISGNNAFNLRFNAIHSPIWAKPTNCLWVFLALPIGITFAFPQSRFLMNVKFKYLLSLLQLPIIFTWYI